MGLYNKIFFVLNLGPFLKRRPPYKIYGGLYFSESHYNRYLIETIATKVSEINVLG